VSPGPAMPSNDVTRPASAAAVHQALAIDLEQSAKGICEFIAGSVQNLLRRRGVVVGLSGGIDSSVCASLCVRALGPHRVLGLFTPEADSAPESLELGRLVADRLGIATILEDITTVVEAAGCYRRRDEAIRAVIPQYGVSTDSGARWRAKLVLPSVVESERYRLFSIVAEAPDGSVHKARLTPDAYRQVIAATSFKQRTRKMLEYYHADRMDYAVVGTPNRLEYDQGFFVKNGDGAADLKPIAHLYKTQVYALAEYLNVPDEIRRRPPTTDTYSLPQGQDEFYFSLPYRQMDLCLCALNLGVAAADLAPEVGLTEDQVERVYADIQAKRRATRHLHLPPLLVLPVLDTLTEALATRGEAASSRRAPLPSPSGVNA
jgi:NAD+ synthase